MTSPGDLDPELAELMALEEAERTGSAGPASAGLRPPAGAAGLDPELAELMALEEAERTGSAGPAAAAPASRATPAGVSGDQADRLRRLAELHDRGVLSDADFAAEQQRILTGY